MTELKGLAPKTEKLLRKINDTQINVVADGVNLTFFAQGEGFLKDR